MRRELPPLGAIRAFEAAAFHGNFTKAADELGMTQAAVSYQIKLLEERLGFELFVRLPRGVALTPSGRQLARGTMDAFDQMREVFGTISESESGMLSISVAPTFAIQFLAPRLGDFQLRHPELAVKVDVGQSLADFRTDQIDVGIRTGAGNWPGLKAHKLLETRSTPVLTPTLSASVGGVDRPEDLLKLKLIGAGDGWWSRWFAAAGLPQAALPKPVLEFGAQAMELNAVLAGQAVGRLSPQLFAREIEQGLLLRPFALDLPDGDPVWLVYPESRSRSRKIASFRTWLLGTLPSV